MLIQNAAGLITTKHYRERLLFYWLPILIAPRPSDRASQGPSAGLAGGFPGNTQSSPQSAAFGSGFLLSVLATPLARAAADSPRAISESARDIQRRLGEAKACSTSRRIASGRLGIG